MPAHSALIHDFDLASVPVFDDEGDQRVGFYYQFVDAQDLPVTSLHGPYRVRVDAERAAQRAFDRRDY